MRTNFFGISNNKSSLVDWIINSVNAKKEIKVFKKYIFFSYLLKTLCKYIFFCKNFENGVYNLGSKNCISKSDFALYNQKDCLIINFD